MARTEKELDLALARSLTLPDFRRWFLSKTKFGDVDSTIWLCRSDHPWGRFPLETADTLIGESRIEEHEGETDVLAVLDLLGGKRIALHIENKLASSCFTKLQAEKYAARAKHWASTAKYGNYVDWETVLVAPVAFFERFREPATRFGAFVSHEELSIRAREFRG